MSIQNEAVTPSFLRQWPLSQEAQSKNDRGTIFIIGGARRTPGAVILAGLAALRAGAGRLNLVVAESAATASAIAVPEAAVIALPENAAGAVLGSGLVSLAEELKSADAVVIGPGLDNADEAAELLRHAVELVPETAKVVLDAYALGVLPSLEDVYSRWRGRLLLTPNPEEAGRLLGGQEPELATAVARIAELYGAAVTGQGTIASADGRGWYVGAGNPGLGTSGSGDVLAGTAGGLLARGAEPAQAACWATYLHSTAGDRLAARVGPVSYLARELLDEIPRVLAELAP